MHQVEQRGRQSLQREQSGADQHRPDRDDHQAGDQFGQVAAGQRRDRGHRQRGDAHRHQPFASEVGDEPGLFAEYQRAGTHDRVDADLGHHREQAGHRRRCGGIAVAQPEPQRQHRSLHREHDQQQQARAAQQGCVLRRRGRDLQREVGEVERAGDPVQQADRHQEQGRCHEVAHEIVQGRTLAAQATAMQHQSVGGNQQQFEEHEQVEQIAGQEGTVEPHQLQLEQGMEMAPARIQAGRGEPCRRQRQQRGQQQHQCRQPVQNQHDAVGCRPVADRIDGRLPGRRPAKQVERGHQQREAGADRHRAARAWPTAIAEGDDERCRQQRQHDRRDKQVAQHGDHRAAPSPSTWSVPLSWRIRTDSASSSAVMPKAITIAVSTSACGRGSA